MNVSDTDGSLGHTMHSDAEAFLRGLTAPIRCTTWAVALSQGHITLTHSKHGFSSYALFERANRSLGSLPLDGLKSPNHRPGGGCPGQATRKSFVPLWLDWLRALRAVEGGGTYYAEFSNRRKRVETVSKGATWRRVSML
jgi:hypothetical protein